MTGRRFNFAILCFPHTIQCNVMHIRTDAFQSDR